MTILFFSVFFFSPSLLHATTDYARETGMECRACHADAIGGALTEEGKKFLAGMKAKGLYRPLSSTQKVVRFFV